MIHIKNSTTADSRSCDFATVSQETLLASSRQHIRDVQEAHQFFSRLLAQAMLAHDIDKITDIHGFHANFITGFQDRDWLDRHYALNRHHLTADGGVPADVNLIDVLDFVADWVMAGMGRSGSVRPVTLPIDILQRALQNTITLLAKDVVVEK